MNETTRITLRALTRSEADATVSNRRVGQLWATDYPTPGDVSVARAVIDGMLALASDTMPWSLYVIVEANGLSIGGIGFKSAPNDHGEVEIGYGVCRSFQGRGVATAALFALCEIARGGASAIVAETDRENAASQRVLEKCGFRFAGETGDLIRWRLSLDASKVL